MGTRTALCTALWLSLVYTSGCREVTSSKKEQPVTLSVVDDPKTYACVKDSECVAVDEGCCSCGEGGAKTAINEEYEQAWTQWVKGDACKNTGCTTELSGSRTCWAPAVCVNAKCTLRPPCGDNEFPIYGSACSAASNPRGLLACAPCKGMTTDIGYAYAVTDNSCYQLSSGGDLACLCKSDTKAKWKGCPH